MVTSNTAKEDKDKWATPWWAFHFAQHWFGFPQFDIDCAASAQYQMREVYQRGTERPRRRLGRHLLLAQPALFQPFAVCA